MRDHNKPIIKLMLHQTYKKTIFITKKKKIPK